VTAIDGLRGAATVVVRGSVVVSVADGPADADAGGMCTPLTRFQIASISKQVAAVAALLLVEAGVVDLHESVQRWLPESTSQWRGVTLHHLLSATAGIRHWDDTPGFRLSESMSVERRLELLTQAPLLSEPGTLWRYSSPGFIVVGSIIERASAQSYGSFVTERILEPLSLRTTTIGDPPADAEVAHGYRDGESVVPFDLTTMPGTGDVLSTVGDLARFNAALHHGALLADSSIEAMCTLQTPLDRPDPDWARGDGYGYGHFVGALGEEVAYFHPGDNPGFKSFNAWLPAHDAAIAVLLNDEAVDLEPILKQLVPFAVTPQAQ
jgi:CubicO group peptidase (beta-lactamase class C family)